MKDCLGFCLLLLFAMDARAEEQQESPISSVPKLHFPLAIQDLIVGKEARWAQPLCDQLTWQCGAGEPRIEYLLSKQKANEWVLKAGSEIQLNPPPEVPHELFWRWGCLLFYR